MSKLSEQESLNLKNSVYNAKNGRYVIGGSTEVSAGMIEWWSKNKNSHDPTDLVYFFEKKYEGRPDMLGYLFYGDVGLWWVICQYNNIINPFDELVEGAILLIPLLSRIKQEYMQTASIGGNISTRLKK